MQHFPIRVLPRFDIDGHSFGFRDIALNSTTYWQGYDVHHSTINILKSQYDRTILFVWTKQS